MPRSRVATKSRSRSSTNASGRPPTLDERAAGILLHVTSLPGGQGSGDFGPSARRFADFLERACHRWWQMLPLNPVGPGFSPYSGVSAFAGNPLLISLDDLAEEGLLDRASLETMMAEMVEADLARHRARMR